MATLTVLNCLAGLLNLVLFFTFKSPYNAILAVSCLTCAFIGYAELHDEST